MVRDGLEASEVRVTLRRASRREAGVNATVKVALWPAAIVTGAVIPLKVNPVPLIPTEEIVTLEPPVLVTDSDRDCLIPTFTLPKLRLVGFEPSAPGATPLPDNAMVSEGFEASEVMV